MTGHVWAAPSLCPFLALGLELSHRGVQLKLTIPTSGEYRITEFYPHFQIQPFKNKILQGKKNAKAI